MEEFALYLVVATSTAMSALLTWSVRRMWIAVSTLSTLASRIAVSSEMLTAQSQTTTAHAALLSGSVDTLRRDLDFPDDLAHGLNYKFLEGDD